MPYITSSIIMQLLSVVIPKVEEWRNEGPPGQKKITQTTRVHDRRPGAHAVDGHRVLAHNGGEPARRRHLRQRLPGVDVIPVFNAYRVTLIVRCSP